MCPELALSGSVVKALHEQKNAHGPTFAGTDSWRQYLSLIETKAKQWGMIDFRRNKFTYQRWFTSNWPDKTGWSLVLGNEDIEVASYGASSGTTGPMGITSDLVLLSEVETRDPKGKILVLSLKPTELEKEIPDWIYAPPENKFSHRQEIKPEDTVYQSTFSQLFAANLDENPPLPGPHYLKLIKQLAPAAVVVIFDMTNERVNGLYSYPVPSLYDIPTLYLGRESGKSLLEGMKTHREATLKLVASIELAEAYQLAGFLPGRDYGTKNDEIILMISHTDGPSISQENGPLGLLGIIHYFNQIKRAERKKTLMLFLDSRHYIPGREASLPDYDIDRVLLPGGPLAPVYGKIVASIHMEHLGQIEFSEIDGRYQATGRMETGSYYVTGYQPIVDMARDALIEYRPENQFLRSTDLPGVHCQSQGIWFGLGHHPRRIGVEVIASNLSFMGAYWSTAAGMDFLDTGQFIKQMNVMTQITGNFMISDMQNILSEKARPVCEPDPQVEYKRDKSPLP